MGVLSKLAGGNKRSRDLRVMGPALGPLGEEKLRALMMTAVAGLYAQHGSRIASCEPVAETGQGRTLIDIKTTEITDAEAAELEAFARACLQAIVLGRSLKT